MNQLNNSIYQQNWSNYQQNESTHQPNESVFRRFVSFQLVLPFHLPCSGLMLWKNQTQAPYLALDGQVMEPNWLVHVQMVM